MEAFFSVLSRIHVNLKVMKVVKSFESLDLNSVYTYADYLKWQFEERVELIKGKIFKMSPAPSRKHQEISFNLSGMFFNGLKGKKCKAYSAPFDVKLPGKSKEDKEITTVVQPDLCIVCDVSKLEERGCTGAPDLIVEILSPSTSKKDLRDKFSLYEEAGVKEYWVVYPEEETLEVFRLNKDNSYVFEKVYVKGDKMKVYDLNLKIEISEVFRF